MRAEAEHLMPVTLELGGKSPTIVSKNADTKLAAKRIAWEKFACAGQTCLAPDYALMEESVHNEFVEALREVAQEFHEDNPMTEYKMGRIVSLWHWELATSWLKGRIAFGGASDKASLFIEPIAVSSFLLSDPVMLEEIFGPILPVLPAPSPRPLYPLLIHLGARLRSPEHQLRRHLHQRRHDTNRHPERAFGGIGGSGMGAYDGRLVLIT